MMILVNECIRIIALYIKGYINTEQFVDIFFSSFTDFEEALSNDIFYSIIETNFTRKEERLTLITKLTSYISECHHISLRDISDSYVEKIIEEGDNPILCSILKQAYVQKDEVTIDCSKIGTQAELMNMLIRKLNFPKSCSNWDAINDMLYDVLFPKKIIIVNWDILRKRLPDDAIILKEMLNKEICICKYGLDVEYA